MDKTKGDQQLKLQVERLSLFHEVGKALVSNLDVQNILQVIMEKLSEFIHADNWSLLMVDEDAKELYFEIAIGTNAQQLKDVRLKIGEGIAGTVAQTGEPLLVADVNSDPRFAARVDEVTGMTTQSVVCVPIRAHGRNLGVIELLNCVGKEKFKEDDLPLLGNLADYAAIALENARYVQRITELTITDDCTSLYNARHLRFVLDAEIYRSRRYGYEFSIIFMDLDRFKMVNDTHGHLAGSKLLSLVGDLIKSNLRLIDYAFRYGGDEFVILLPQTGKEQAFVVVQRLKDLLNSTVFLAEEGLNLKLTASFGLACFPQDGQTRNELLLLADKAMYLAKQTRRNSIAVANEGIRA